MARLWSCLSQVYLIEKLDSNFVSHQLKNIKARFYNYFDKVHYRLRWSAPLYQFKANIFTILNSLIEQNIIQNRIIANMHCHKKFKVIAWKDQTIRNTDSRLHCRKCLLGAWSSGLIIEIKKKIKSIYLCLKWPS